MEGPLLSCRSPGSHVFPEIPRSVTNAANRACRWGPSALSHSASPSPCASAHCSTASSPPSTARSADHSTRSLSRSDFWSNSNASRASSLVLTHTRLRASIPAAAPSSRKTAGGGRTRAVLYEPPSFLRDATTVRRMTERDLGSGHGVLYDTPRRGSATPFGATAEDDGVNFAIHSSGATAVSICLFTEEDLAKGQPRAEVPLHPVLNRTGDVWHVFLPSLAPHLLYGYRIDGPFEPEKAQRFDKSKIVLDPYAKAVLSRDRYGQLCVGGDCWPQMAGMVPNKDEDEYDWEGDRPPHLPLSSLVIYEAHVRGFTQHASSGVQHKGTYKGLCEKLPYLKSIGITALELMPVHEFNELEYYQHNEATNDYKFNFWGYSTVGFFSPMLRYASVGGQECGRAAIREFKDMVKACHRHGIEVILDVVLNHTAEGNELGPTITFRGVDNRVFYMTAPRGEFYNYSGCGNTFNCNHPVVRRFIVDCLRYWVLDMHVDGFRFDLASILTRASSLWDPRSVFGSSASLPALDDGVSTGTPLMQPPVIEAISNDPVLREVKLIAEAWDAGGLYQVGSFPHWGVWSEWNGQYRDSVRQFIKGSEGSVGMFAEALCGSPNLYKSSGRSPFHSINFVTAHDGFTLSDLVSFNEKHNEANGNNNTDGEDNNISWNCGEEGEDASVSVQRLRQRQMRNFLLALFVSQGVPMVLMGDECAQTKHGNNNTYCHDSQFNYFNWSAVEEDSSGLLRFFQAIVALRKEFSCFRLPSFPTSEHLQWHGLQPETPDWSEKSKFIAFTLRDSSHELYIAFNASHLPLVPSLPHRPSHSWHPLVDTSKPPPFDVLAPDLTSRDREVAVKQAEGMLAENYYPMLGYSAAVLQLVPETAAAAAGAAGGAASA